MPGKVRAKMSAGIKKILGKNCLVYLNFGETATEDAPQWTAIGGQTTGDLDISADSIDGTNKSSGGWGETYQGTKSLELNLEGYIPVDDEAYDALKEAMINDEAVDICRYFKDAQKADRAWYNITKLSDKTPHDDMVAFTATLGGVGAPRFYTGVKTIDDVGKAGSTATEVNS